MSIAPLSQWISTYQTKLQAYYTQCQTVPTTPVATFWQDWVDSNTKGIQSAAPYAGAKGTTTAGAFSPVVFSPSMLPPASALVLASAWKAYYSAITWAPMPSPVAPFSVILTVVSSPSGMAAAYSALLSGLTAEFLSLPPDPASAMATKATAIGTLFYTATLAGGIQLDGLATSGTPPPPVTVALSGVE